MAKKKFSQTMVQRGPKGERLYRLERWTQEGGKPGVLEGVEYYRTPEAMKKAKEKWEAAPIPEDPDDRPINEAEVREIMNPPSDEDDEPIDPMLLGGRGDRPKRK